MKIKGTFFFVVAIYFAIIVGIIVYMQEPAQDIARFDPEGMDAISSFEFHGYNSNLHDYTAQQSTGLPTRKPFIYLTQTEQCLPPNLANSSQIGDPETCNCDVMVLSYQAKCQENKQSHINYLFDPSTLFASGRNVLFFAARDRKPGYHYYIFLDDDIVLKFNSLTPTDMIKMSPFRVVEKWLLDYEPALGVLDYRYHGASHMHRKRKHFCGITETSLVLPTTFFDANFNAFHYKAVGHILPYPTQYERKCIFSSNRNTMLAVEIKFGGQALLFAPITADNPKHRKEYDRSLTNLTAMMREFIERIEREAPLKLRNHVIFKMLHKNPDFYLQRQSRSFCLDATRHEPIIPFRHLLNRSSSKFFYPLSRAPFDHFKGNSAPRVKVPLSIVIYTLIVRFAL
ncbi:uncharacterized protein LOC144654913 [Oculina patagonica]